MIKCFEPCMESDGYRLIKGSLTKMFRKHLEIIMNGKNVEQVLDNYIENVYNDINSYLPFLFVELHQYQFVSLAPMLRENDRAIHYDIFYIVVDKKSEYITWGYYNNDKK